MNVPRAARCSIERAEQADPRRSLADDAHEVGELCADLGLVARPAGQRDRERERSVAPRRLSCSAPNMSLRLIDTASFHAETPRRHFA